MIALSPTDRGWFLYLQQRPDLSVVNFWTPTDWNVQNLSNGDYWYFVLKGAEPRKIGGGGRFLEYKLMRASRAWELYGTGNGSASYQEMVERLNKHINKRSQTSRASNDPEIGCVLLDNCAFLPEYEQKTAQDFGLSFPRQIVKFKSFDNPPLILAEQEKIPGVFTDSVDNLEEFNPSNEEDARKKTLASIVRRQGQPRFRQALLAAYENKCAITGCDVTDALEAAHITPYIGEHTNTVQNGLLLRADIHTLFDLGKIAISPTDFRVILQQELRYSHYAALEGKMIAVPKDKTLWPSSKALDIHKKDTGL